MRLEFIVFLVILGLLIYKRLGGPMKLNLKNLGGKIKLPAVSGDLIGGLIVVAVILYLGFFLVAKPYFLEKGENQSQVAAEEADRAKRTERRIYTISHDRWEGQPVTIPAGSMMSYSSNVRLLSKWAEDHDGWTPSELLKRFRLDHVPRSAEPAYYARETYMEFYSANYEAGYIEVTIEEMK